MKQLIKESVQFKECTKVALHNVKSIEFDIVEVLPLSNDGYCQALIDKIFEISHSEIADFIKHQLLYVKDKLHWINKFEKLVSVNESLFKKERNKTKLMKIITTAETIRNSLNKPTTIKDEDRPAPRFINAESEERYFSFTKTSKEVDLIEDYCEKILFLTDEKYEYEQANIHFINPKLNDYAYQCEKKISQLQNTRLIKEELKDIQIEKSSFNKIQFNGNVNQLVDIFYQLSRELFVNGKNYIDGNANDIAKMIAYSFVDKDGDKLSIETVKTILTPSREEKRPNNAKRIDVDKLL
ncbi:hypothetical protein IF128_12995 [Empedobacter stercoris]|uniref:hypothetical protein n=1 Tax=Empedobacter stercoris TaxID=1628248 RepID=UPI0016625AFB|nr:hypothetical protein [Empedobacter stercoris]MCA4810645.1 hypothetical protein [Empedobacter stercoris]QNT13405.1 hypothetical protein HNV03_01215 [Empedobacter stercoris]